MSGTGEPVTAPVVEPVVAPAAPETPAIVNEVDIPPDGGFTAEPELPLEAPKEPVEASPEPEPPKIKKSAFQSRVDALTIQRDKALRREEEALQQAELYKAMADGKGAPPLEDGTPAPQPKTFGSQAEFDKAVREHASTLAAQELAKGRTDKLLASGNTEYKDFTERCNAVAALGAGDRPDFMQIVTDPDVITNGSKIIALLAEKPDEAARILGLPSLQMAAALVKFEAENSKAATPKPLSSLPAPIKPIDGQSRGNEEPSDKDSMPEYARKYHAQQLAKLKDKQPSRFAKH